MANARLLVASRTPEPQPDWLSQIEELPRHRGVSGAAAVREAREELP